jgi:hypothetical protein
MTHTTIGSGPHPTPHTPATTGTDPGASPAPDRSPAVDPVRAPGVDPGRAPGPGPELDPVREARLAGVLRSWWLDERPAWTDPGWWDAPVRAEVRRLLWLPAGPDLAAALADLPRNGVCPAPHADDRVLPGFPTPGHAPGWPCACQVVTAAGWEACAAWVAAGAAEALVDAAGPAPVAFDTGGHQIHDPARDELAPALRSTTGSMGNRITAARSLLAHPALVDLLATGAVSGWAARVVTREVDTLDPDQATTVVTAVCDRIRTRNQSSRRAYNSAEVARITRSTRLRLAGAPDQHIRARAHAQRRVQVLPGTDGMATLIADLAETDAHRIHHRLTALTAALRTGVYQGPRTGPLLSRGCSRWFSVEGSVISSRPRRCSW